MPALFALATSVGVLAVAATWLFFVPLAATDLQVWQAFIAWGCYYHSGGKPAGGITTVLCMSFGAAVGLGSFLLNDQIGALGQFSAPVAVGIGAAVICLASSISFLKTIPASVYGFASIAGLALLKPGITPVNALLPTIASVVIGALFGYVSEVVAGALTKK